MGKAELPFFSILRKARSTVLDAVYLMGWISLVCILNMCNAWPDFPHGPVRRGRPRKGREVHEGQTPEGRQAR